MTTPAIGHMPFPGTRTQKQVRVEAFEAALAERARKQALAEEDAKEATIQ